MLVHVLHQELLRQGLPLLVIIRRQLYHHAHQELFQQQLRQALRRLHLLVDFLLGMLLHELILLHHHVHLPHQRDTDMDQRHTLIHLRSQVMEVLLNLLQEHIHHMMSTAKTYANTLILNQRTACSIQTLSRQLSPKDLMVLLTLTTERLSLTLSVLRLENNKTGSIKVLACNFYQRLQKVLHHHHSSHTQTRIQLTANSHGIVTSGTAEPKAS